MVSLNSCTRSYSMLYSIPEGPAAKRNERIICVDQKWAICSCSVKICKGGVNAPAVHLLQTLPNVISFFFSYELVFDSIRKAKIFFRLFQSNDIL